MSNYSYDPPRKFPLRLKSEVEWKKGHEVLLSKMRKARQVPTSYQHLHEYEMPTSMNLVDLEQIACDGYINFIKKIERKKWIKGHTRLDGTRVKPIWPFKQEIKYKQFHVLLTPNRSCALFRYHFSDGENGSTLYWLQEGLKNNKGDISLLSGFELGAYYMNADFEFAILAIHHILTEHARSISNVLKTL